MAYFTFTSTPLTMTICRALITKYAKSIGILLSMFSFFVHSASDNQIEQIKTAAEQHILATVDQPDGGELSVNAADIDSR
ncbi:flagellar basal body P-ring formation chaperone FlgA, partial [Vibrio antiquarius]